MSEWREVTLGELIDSGECAIYNNLRQPLSAMERNQMKHGKLYPYYGAASAIDFINKYRFDGYYLLIAEDGTVTFDGIRPMLQLVDGKFWVSNHAHVLQCESKWKTTLLYYLLLNIDINPYITGAVQPKLSKRNLLSILLSIPKSEPEQRAIASVLSSLDDKIDLLHRENKTLEAMAETLFRQWFIEEAKDEWEDAKLGEVVTITYGKNLPIKKLLKSGYPVFGGNGQIGFYNKYLYVEPQVLVSCRGEASGKVNISLPRSFITNNSLILVRDKRKEITFEYLKYHSLNYDFTLHISGSAQPQITIDNLYDAAFLIPPVDLINKFTEVVRGCEEKRANNLKQIHTLEKLRDTLLPKLMSGEVRVKYEEEEMASCRA